MSSGDENARPACSRGAQRRCRVAIVGLDWLTSVEW